VAAFNQLPDERRQRPALRHGGGRGDIRSGFDPPRI
jgi:hypothetical protein